MTIDIADLDESDIPAFHACLDAVAKEQRWLALTAAPPLAQVRQFVLGGMHSGVVRVVARDGNAVVGWVDIQPGWMPTLRHCGTLGMGVRSDYRRRGIGARLLDAALQRATAQGISRVELDVRADNTAALALYARLGFEREGLKRHGLRFGDRYFDVVLLARVTA